MNEEFYVKHLTEKRVMGPLLDVLINAMPRDNLLTSACLEFFDFIKKENVKELVKHLVKNYRERLEKLRYIDLFRDMVVRYDQTQGFTANMEFFLETEEEVGRRPMHPNARLMDQISVDPAEEEYWNTSDDDEEHQAKTAEKTPAGVGAPNTPSRPLVDYPSDEETEDKSDENSDPSAILSAEETKAHAEGETNGIVVGEHQAVSAAAAAATPPERISEKRRREEEDEDELGKLVHTKRRNSSSAGSTTSATGASSGMVRRKKSFSGSAGGGAPKKIAISLSPTVKAGPNGKAEHGS